MLQIVMTADMEEPSRWENNHDCNIDLHTDICRFRTGSTDRYATVRRRSTTWWLHSSNHTSTPSSFRRQRRIARTSQSVSGRSSSCSATRCWRLVREAMMGWRSKVKGQVWRPSYCCSTTCCCTKTQCSPRHRVCTLYIYLSLCFLLF